jgi:hypothetical protein
VTTDGDGRFPSRDRSIPFRVAHAAGAGEIRPARSTPRIAAREQVTTMNATETEDLLRILEARFDENPHRHPGIAWPDVRARLDANPAALESLRKMEDAGGEPDVIGPAGDAGRFIFCDCSAESPAGRRSICYDAEGRMSRKENRPVSSACEMAAEMGIEILTEELYRKLQTLGEFDRKTSSWIATPADVRSLGGALFCDRRYGRVFVYHNGAQSYYAARGFRGWLRV